MKKINTYQALNFIKKLEEELMTISIVEEKNSTFVAATTEDKESVRPFYDFAGTLLKKQNIINAISDLKYLISVHNLDKCLDSKYNGHISPTEAMCKINYLRQLYAGLRKLALNPQRQRENVTGSVIDYRYANYDVNSASVQLEKVKSELEELKELLEKYNHTVEFEVYEGILNLVGEE